MTGLALNKMKRIRCVNKLSRHVSNRIQRNSNLYFPEESKKNIENLDTEISAFFDYIEGSIQSFEGDCASSSESNYGKRKTELDGMYLILTEKERYCMNFYMYSEDDENAQNVGIYKIEIALESEVAEDNFIWDNPPNGIFVGGQN